MTKILTNPHNCCEPESCNECIDTVTGILWGVSGLVDCENALTEGHDSNLNGTYMIDNFVGIESGAKVFLLDLGTIGDPDDRGIFWMKSLVSGQELYAVRMRATVKCVADELHVDAFLVASNIFIDDDFVTTSSGSPGGLGLILTGIPFEGLCSGGSDTWEPALGCDDDNIVVNEGSLIL